MGILVRCAITGGFLCNYRNLYWGELKTETFIKKLLNPGEVKNGNIY